jgi:bifunctional UDP-N-acetylglucosamine pyrophosphorylase/glucosamine-1-phosphate N-acetyltransferase
VVTKPVEADALCLVRPEQVGKAGWAAAFRERMKAKKAAK